MKLLFLTRESNDISKQKYYDDIEREIKDDRITLYNLDQFLKNTNAYVNMVYLGGELTILIDRKADEPDEIDDDENDYEFEDDDEYYESLEKRWLDEEAEAHEED